MGHKSHMVPGLLQRMMSVWNRHVRVYGKNIIGNGFPAFAEPLIFLTGIGMGLGVVIREMDGVPYLQFLGSGIVISTAMMTSAFECSYGTFIRLEFEKVYDGMLAAPISVRNLLVGEIFWAGTKGFFFSFAVLIVMSAVGIFRVPQSLLVPFVGFLTGILFASLSLVVTSFVKSIDQFSFYFTGLLSPMFFFSGIVFPLSSLPKPLMMVAEMMPLTHPVRISRSIFFMRHDPHLWFDLLYMVIVTLIFAVIGIRRLTRKLID
jgi:lipooligosaccharide transport system permease protein